MSEKKGPDPGWNDPPTFTYDRAAEIQSIASKKGNILNKRVAYPLSGPAASLTRGIDPTTPPQPKGLEALGTPPISSMPPILSSNSSSANNTIVETCPENALDEIIKNLKIRMNGISTEQGDELSKRLDVMQKMWVEEKLNLDVQLRLLELSKAILDYNLVEADRLQKSLSVDHISVCSSWMGGVRLLINILREQQNR